MRYDGIIITGTSASGKSTIAKLLVKKNENYGLVKAITTRGPRGDDDGHYLYVKSDEFKRQRPDLMTYAKYRDNEYGIHRNQYSEVCAAGKIPVLIIAPESIKEDVVFDGRTRNMVVYIDSDDDELIARIDRRDAYKQGQKDVAQRERDREYANYADYYLKSKDGNLEELVDFIEDMWQFREESGVLPFQFIEKLIRYGNLITPYNVKNISSASYDMTVGEKYWKKGVRKLDGTDVIVIEPGEFVVIQSEEYLMLPPCFSGRFDLTVSMFCKGLILSNGPQVDPGFEGRLFCLLFNASNVSVELKKGDHYASIEFTKILEKTIRPYNGRYQGKSDIIDMLPLVATMDSIIRVVCDELKELKKQDPFWIKYLPIILSSLSIVVALASLSMVYYKAFVAK